MVAPNTVDEYLLGDDVMDNADPMAGGNEIELPFPAPVIYTLRGEPAFKGLGNAQYFGGWATDGQKFDQSLEASGLLFPLSFEEGTASGNDGEYKIYTTRSLAFVPIVQRASWFKKNERRSAKYFDGARRHVQIVAYLAFKSDDGKAYLPWGPAVLSSKGFQAKNVQISLRTWADKSAKARKQFANELPYWYFWHACGTWGTERKTQEVGKKEKNKITPVEGWFPKEFTPELVKVLFVGRDVAAQMKEYKAASKDWVEAWSSLALDGKSNGSNGNGHGSEPVFAGEEEMEEGELP